ncbi:MULTISPECIES: hypothetical protein [Bradyrhizobium]|uniref:hypothetical protein n=1 Tax=Bradyrhizobium TaxID=374 RepID=UPI001408440F|nr:MULTISPECIES: hypothetical protein [Bradyrhizobium]MCK7669148.1 hypothetical protein [Bradyrhizobium sp. 2S1]MCK7671477.1 hypothetical protein [Bradyrhizobium sp. 2S1]UGY23786.1 hypothetical protein HU675_0038545 [Bradyrhizobium septentrionale]
MSIQIARDSFARQDLCREVVATSQDCDWCGGFRYRSGRKLQALFRYSTETDGGRTHDHRGLFCSKGCHDSYHDQ